MPLEQSTRLVSEISSYVKRQFGDESGAQITDADIIRWVNAGQEEIALREGVGHTTITTPSVTGQSQYSFPSNAIIKISTIYYAGTPLQNTSFEQAQNTFLSDSAFASLKSTPTNWYEWGDSIFLYPLPQSNNDTIQLFVTLRPTAVTSTSSTINLPDSYFNALVQYVLSQAYELDDEFDKAQVKQQQFSSTLDQLGPDTSFKTYSVLTISPEDQ